MNFLVPEYVDRQALKNRIKLVTGWEKNYGEHWPVKYYLELMDAIDGTPTAYTTPEPKWINTKNAMPDEIGWYLAVVHNPFSNYSIIRVIECRQYFKEFGDERMVWGVEPWAEVTYWAALPPFPGEVKDGVY